MIFVASFSRPTVTNWLEACQSMQTVHLVRPFSGGGRRGIVAQPCVIGFGTGFVARTLNDCQVGLPAPIELRQTLMSRPHG